MAEAARKLREDEQLESWRQTMAIQAKQVRQQREAQIIPFRPKQNPSSSPKKQSGANGGEVIPLGFAQAMQAEEELDTAERFHAEQARLAAANQSIGLSPAVERMAANDFLNADAYRQAEAKVEALTQQMRAAESLAELQALNVQYQILNEELLDAGLSEEQRARFDGLRRWAWRGIEDAAPALDDVLLGSDMGIGTIAADMINGWQVLYGMALGGDPEPYHRATLFVPPPLQPFPQKDLGFVERTMIWWDLLYTVLLWVVQNGWWILAACFTITLLGVLATCIANPADSLCAVSLKGASDIFGAISGATDPTGAGLLLNLTNSAQ